MPVSLQHEFTRADGGTICSSNRNECKAFDQGLLTVSGHSVQLTDASEFATCVHASGPRDDLLIQSPIAMSAKHLIRVS
jgi:hypothetical protein